MTQKEKEERLAELKKVRHEQKKEFIKEYEEKVAEAASVLKMKLECSKACHIEALRIIDSAEVERNHESWTKNCAHQFMRYMKKHVMAFEADRREFEYDGEQIAATMAAQFQITDDKVVYAMTVTMKRKEH